MMWLADRRTSFFCLQAAADVLETRTVEDDPNLTF